MCADPGEIMKSMESRHVGEKRHLAMAALFPAVVGLQMGTKFATKAEKHLNFIYKIINNTKTVC